MSAACFRHPSVVKMQTLGYISRGKYRTLFEFMEREYVNVKQILLVIKVIRGTLESPASLVQYSL